MDENGNEPAITRALELAKLAAAVIGALASLAAAFSFVGLAIVFSFVYSLGVYGLPNFVEAFFSEAAISFFGDLFRTVSGKSVLVFLVSVFVFGTLACLDKLIESPDKKIKLRRLGITLKRKRVIALSKWLFPALTLGAIVTTFAVRATLQPGVRRGVLYLVSVPALVGTGIYLGTHVRSVKDASRHIRFGYAVYFFLFLFLAISIPFEYGTYVFDIPVYRVIAMDLVPDMTPKADDEEPGGLIRGFHRSVNTGTRDRVYYVMGRTDREELFFVLDYAHRSLNVVMIDRDLINFIRIRRPEGQDIHNVETLRSTMSTLDGSRGQVGGESVDPADESEITGGM